MEGQGPTRQNERDPTPSANAITPDTDCQTIADMIVAELESIVLSDETPVKASPNEKKIEESVPTASKAATADARNEREATAAAQANAEAVFLDHDTLARIIAAKLHDYNISHNPAVKVSTIEEKIEETVSIAFRSAMANFFHKPAVDVTALRVQTLANIEFLYDLMTDLSDPTPPKRTFSAPKLVTTVKSVRGGQHFGASVVRIELNPEEGTVPDVTIEVRGCKSNIEAMQKLHEFSQDVLSNARVLSHSALIQARFDFWDELESIRWGGDRHIGGGWC